MNKQLLLIASLFFIAGYASAQKNLELGGEYLRVMGKGYNNSKVAVRAENFSDKNAFSLGVTYQLASKKNYSVSSGFGAYLGYRRYFGNNVKGNGMFLGARVLFSFENFEGQTNRNSLFITPWAEAGYHFVFAKSYFAAPSVGYGYTKKISKDYNSLNEDDGGRFIPSLSAGFRL